MRRRWRGKPLPWLALNFITAIVNGRQPRQLKAMTLMRNLYWLPVAWAEQRALLGFTESQHALKRVGPEMRMLVEGSKDQTAADPSLLRIVARPHDIQARLSQNTELTGVAETIHARSSARSLFGRVVAHSTATKK
jgi:hypothetical protein